MNRKIISAAFLTLLATGIAGCGSGPDSEGEGAYFYDGNYCSVVVTPDASGENEAGQGCDDDDDCANGLYCDNYNLETTPSCTCKE